MKFHKRLYLGDSVRRAEIVKWKLKHHSGQLRVFVVALRHGSDQLEICHCAFLKQRYYRKHPPYIVGIANGYREALGLVEQMARDTYEATGDCRIKDYFLKN